MSAIRLKTLYKRMINLAINHNVLKYFEAKKT